MRTRSSSLPYLTLAITLAACGGSPRSSATEPTTPPPAQRTLVLVDDKGVGLEGLDPISYTAEGGPVAGSQDHATAHGGATYWFASADRRATFEADPPKFVPAYGGYCAFAASQNRLSPADPSVFVIHEGQLLVFTNEAFRDSFNQDPAGNKQKADANWSGLIAKHGR